MIHEQSEHFDITRMCDLLEVSRQGYYDWIDRPAPASALRREVMDEAIRDGVDVRAFFHWTGVDNYEWTYGYDVPFGLFTRDREPRGSAAMLAEHIATERTPS